METKGTYTLSYYSEKVIHDVVVVVQLKQIDGMLKPGQNVWEGVATINGQPYEEEDLTHCVNALLAAERIGLKRKQILKENCKLNNMTFRVKTETIK